MTNANTLSEYKSYSSADSTLDCGLPELLSHGEYNRLARNLHAIQCTPADLLLPDAKYLSCACQHIVDEKRMQNLLGRGFLLSQVVEYWQARALWVVSSADAAYSRRLKARLREAAPPVLYDCGDITFLETGSLTASSLTMACQSVVQNWRLKSPRNNLCCLILLIIVPRFQFFPGGKMTVGLLDRVEIISPLYFSQRLYGSGLPRSTSLFSGDNPSSAHLARC